MSTDQSLVERIAAVAENAGDQDADWVDVQRRARALQQARRRRAPRTALAAAAGVAIATVVGAPALGVTSPVQGVVDEIFGDKEVRKFQEAHPDPDVLPREFLIARRGNAILGRVVSSRVHTIEILYTNGERDKVDADSRGRFVHQIPAGKHANAIVVRGRDERIIESAPIPPPAGEGSGDSPSP
jgi:hypothetical protein